jgi:hypothetical protein
VRDRLQGEHGMAAALLSACVQMTGPGCVRVRKQRPHHADDRRGVAIGGRCTGAENAERFGARNAVPGEFLVRLRVTRVIAERDVSD